ncbi:MAG: family 10 glycosylhydrolase [Alistipes sp.]|jgi:uncharacterized lipoprotein YddW (UPF0748 family)|nr:family 10 glycosylhydrolase [Alistipes sp.]
MKKSILTLLLIAAAGAIVACSAPKQTASTEYPMFWTWLDYRAGMNLDSICVVMKESGLDGLILNAPTPDDYRAAIPVANKHGIEVYAWLWTMNLEHDREMILRDHPDWLQVNRNGESLADNPAYVDYYRFLCPAIPEVREYIKDKIRAYCEVDGLNGIAIDYHRFVDVILPTTLWPRYDVVQDHEYPEFDYGYHPAMIEKFKALHGYDPRELADPSTDEKWLQFRCDQITEVANEIAEVVHSYGKKMAASPFPTPEMSRKMVRQDWGKWNLDIVFPMVYYGFYTGDTSFIADCTIDNVKQKNPMTTLFTGMSGVDGPAMFESMDAALNNGAEGVAIFTVNSLRSPEVRAQFKAYADNARARRAEGAYPVDMTGKKANTDPFTNAGIMSAVDMHMQAYLSLAKALKTPALKSVDRSVVEAMAVNAMQVNLPEEYTGRLSASRGRRGQPATPNTTGIAIAEQFKSDYAAGSLSLGDYALADEYGATKVYKVTDAKSAVTFDVTFYFYGGVISGWSVRPEAASYSAYSNKI